MKAIITRLAFLLPIIFSPLYSFSQKDSVTMYFDENAGLCTKEKAVYIAKGGWNSYGLNLSFFDKKTGIRIMESTYTDTTLSVKNGLCILYDDNGVQMIKKGNYINNKEEGYWLSWRDRLKDSTYYENGVEISKVTVSYHEGSDKLASRTFYDNKKYLGETLRWDSTGLLVSKTILVRSDEETHFYYADGKVKEIERRPFGQQPTSKYYSQNGKDITKQVLKEKEQDELILSNWPNGGNKPAFPGGRNEFFDFIKRNFAPMPRSSLSVGSTLSFTVSFMLDRKGNAKDITVEGGWQDDKIKMASVITRMPSWKMNGLTSYGPITIQVHLTMIY